MAATSVGAFLETLSGIRPLPEHAVTERVVSELLLRSGSRIADLTHERVVGDYGVFGDLSADGNYQLSQQWGLALWKAGFNGVQYMARHHPRFAEPAIALFGPPGVNWDLLDYEKPEPNGGPASIDDELLGIMSKRFGIHVVPATDLG